MISIPIFCVSLPPLRNDVVVPEVILKTRGKRIAGDFTYERIAVFHLADPVSYTHLHLAALVHRVVAAAATLPVDRHDLARLDVAHELGTQHVERAGFARHDIAAIILIRTSR